MTTTMPMPIPSHEHILTRNEKRDLRGELFRNIELVAVDLTDADLRDARFERVVLRGCDLANADLRGAHFVLCELTSVAFHNVRLGDNRFYGTTLADVAGLSDDDQRLVERVGGVFQPPHASCR
jgi:uncharacterized protein YjbI with pentapeptide repeats